MKYATTEKLHQCGNCGVECAKRELLSEYPLGPQDQIPDLVTVFLINHQPFPTTRDTEQFYCPNCGGSMIFDKQFPVERLKSGLHTTSKSFEPGGSMA